MNLQNLINSDNVLCNAHARSKKHCLEILSELLNRSNPDIASEEIFAKLIERERLGCTGLNQGVAFPHCRVQGVESSTGALMKLSSPVEFDSADGESVDLILGLMVPEELDRTHHADIRLITGLLADDTLRARLRSAGSSSELYESLLAGQHEPLPKMQHARVVPRG